MNLSEEQEIKKEFQLERVILFSDAVFAIIITIMVIDIKLPETIKEMSAVQIEKAFTHLYLKFTGYALSFFLVSLFWMRHVKLFSYLKDYNRNVLLLNLAFLFFVSLFPFAINLITGTVKPGTQPYAWGVNIYISMLLATTFTQTLLTSYLIKHKETLCFANDVIEQQLKWGAIKWNKLTIPIILVVLIAFNYFSVPYMFSFYLMAIYGVTMGRIIRKMYPESKESGTFLNRLFNRQKKSRKAQLPAGD